ncbi:MAG TPA: PAS domain S-box protein [Candidatus Angelobacter sp.]|nr:PAS domain S-box protein [Candidatus Angelobacter sp.]
MAGWTAYSASRFFTILSLSHSSRIWTVLGDLFFLVGVGLFAATVLIYVSRKRLVLPVTVIIAIAAVLGLSRDLWQPSAVWLRWAYEITWRLGMLIASVQMVRFAWGRRNIGRWVLAVMLLALRHDLGQGVHSIPSYDIGADLLLGIGMMTMVLDDSRVRIQRLKVLNTITQEFSGDFSATVKAVLRELVDVTRSKAGWFRILQGDTLVLTAHHGLSDDFIAAVRSMPLSLTTTYALDVGEVVMQREAEPTLRQSFRKEGIHHIVIVPVRGETSRVGVLVLGVPGFREHTDNEKRFFRAVARQLGLAAENRTLVEQVLQSRNEWANTFDSLTDSVLVHDPEYRILRANRALLERLRLASGQVEGKTCDAVLPGAGERWKLCPYCSGEDSTDRVDLCFGGYSIVSTSTYSGEGPSRAGAVHIIKDITEAKAAEERYASIFDHMHEGVFVSAPEGKILDCNRAFVNMLGYSSKEEILKLDVVESLYVNPEHREKFLRLMAEQGYVRNFEFRLRRRDGKQIQVIESSFATRSPSGEIERYQGILLDVSEMKRAEEEIRRRNRELYVLNNIAVTFNQSFDLDEILQLTLLQIVELLSTDTAALYLFDEDSSSLGKKGAYGHRSSWLKESERFPLPADFVDAIKLEHAEIIDHEHLQRMPDIVKRMVEAEGLNSWIWVMLWRKEKLLGVLATSSRTSRHFNASEESVLIAVGRQLATTIEKIQLYHETKRAYEDLRRTQEQLLQSEKMSAVGQLISGVAHELNNPLTAILGYTQLLETEPLDKRVKEFIQKLQKQAQRTQKIVQNLLSFARQHKPKRVHVDLRTVIEDSIALRDYDLKVNNIVVDREFDPLLPSVIADPHQLEQVYLNIINNAADAMLDGARGGLLRVRVFPENGHVVSEFHDSGSGIDDPKHVFDPFYTTKVVGKGTGLGLSICYGIVKEHGGEISASNHPSGGAVLQVRLPAAVGEKPVSERDRIVARRESRLEGRVLLLDDEEAVLDFEREVLKAAGLDVTAVTTGAEAIRLMQEEEFDAILLDSKIPGEWSSEDVYRWIAQERTSLLTRTVLVLSNVSDPSVRKFVEATHILCLVKPFEVSDLLAVSRRVLRRVKAVATSQ